MEQLTVFVTGAGALLGHGILRCLRMAKRPIRIITGDPDHRAAGHWLGDCAYTIPMASDPKFISKVEEIIDKEEVDFLFLGTDVELPLLSRERMRLESMYNVRIIISSPNVIEIANDKWLTSKFLEKEGFPFTRSALVNDKDAIEALLNVVNFPLFAKPRRGARSVGIQKIMDREMLNNICSKQTDMIIQEYLPDDEGEFTAGCLVLNGKCNGEVILRRDLRDGNTYRAYADTSGRFEKRIAEISERLGVEGPCNFQFRVREGEPVIFEINARFSGTTPIRAIFGFNEVEALLGYFVDGKPIAKADINAGVVLKVWSDIFVTNEQLNLLRSTGKLSNPECKAYPFF